MKIRAPVSLLIDTRISEALVDEPLQTLENYPDRQEFLLLADASLACQHDEDPLPVLRTVAAANVGLCNELRAVSSKNTPGLILAGTIRFTG
jgi:hypothetical protein